MATPCAGDPAHNVGDSWLCDNGCDTCTCLDSGEISAAGCDRGDEGTAAAEASEQFEALIVKIAGGFALIFVCFLIFVCYLMCVKGGSDNSSSIIRQMEDEEREMEEASGSGAKKSKPSRKARR